MHERPIVVGVDGTATALRAVTWAADEAQARRRPLHIVHAAPYLGPAEEVEAPATRRRADALLARARAVALHAQPDLDVVVRLLREPPISALVDVSADADLLVLGMLGDADAEIVLGPVALDVMTGAQCPVTVVHGHGIDGYGRPAPVLLGIESVEADAAAVTVAFADAARRHTDVVVVHVPRQFDHPAATAATAASVRNGLAPWRSQHPEVGVDVRIDHGNPGIALLHESANARHIVIGTRGRGVAARAVLGSVSRFVLRHSRVPVTVVPRRLSADHVARTPSAQDPHDRSQLW